jgi:hypothetical protein
VAAAKKDKGKNRLPSFKQYREADGASISSSSMRRASCCCKAGLRVAQGSGQFIAQLKQSLRPALASRVASPKASTHAEVEAALRGLSAEELTD